MLDQVKIPGRRKFEMTTYVVAGIQHDCKRGGDYYEATCALATLGNDGVWSVPESEYIAEGDDRILNPSLLRPILVWVWAHSPKCPLYLYQAPPWPWPSVLSLYRP